MMHFGQFGGGHGPRRHGWDGEPGPRRVRRGNVRAAVLALLSEQPMHGYQMIQELSRRSGGRWNPSPGSIYPTLQMLEDEGLVTSQQSPDGKRLFQLTDAGREEAARLASSRRRPPWEQWEQPGDQAGGPPTELLMAIGEAARMLVTASATATDQQRAQIVTLLEEFRREVAAIVPDAAGGPAPGWQRSQRSRGGAGWPFGIPDWIFRGSGGPFAQAAQWGGGARARGSGSSSAGASSVGEDAAEDDSENGDLGDEDDVTEV